MGLRSRLLRAAAIQMSATVEVEHNLATARRLVTEAAGEGAELVVLPEKWPVLGAIHHMRAGAQELDGDAMAELQRLVAELGIDLVAGSVSEPGGEGERLFNSSVHIGPDGEVKAVYRKLHLFDVDLESLSYRESDNEQAGDELVCSSAADGTGIGLTICYDLRFPELYRALALAGARVLCVPAAFTLETTRAHWEILLRARAIEQQCFVIAANQFGPSASGIEAGGRSMIIDAWGEVLAEAPEEGEAVLVADLDMAHLDEVRRRIPAHSARRADVYADPIPIIEP